MKPFEGARVILWAEHPALLAAVGQTLSNLGCHIQSAESLEQVREAIVRDCADLIVAQLCYCFHEPLELLHQLDLAEALPPVLMVTSPFEVFYMEAVREGAFDCLGFPVDEKELIRIASRALQARGLQTGAVGAGNE